MSFAESFEPFFSVSEFAEQATLNGQTVAGILEPGFADASLDGWGGAGSSPRFTLPAASVPPGVEGMLLQVTTGYAQGSYRVANAMPDATGLVTLHLLEA